MRPRLCWQMNTISTYQQGTTRSATLLKLNFQLYSLVDSLNLKLLPALQQPLAFHQGQVLLELLTRAKNLMSRRCLQLCQTQQFLLCSSGARIRRSPSAYCPTSCPVVDGGTDCLRRSLLDRGGANLTPVHRWSLQGSSAHLEVQTTTTSGLWSDQRTGPETGSAHSCNVPLAELSP